MANFESQKWSEEPFRLCHHPPQRLCDKHPGQNTKARMLGFQNVREVSFQIFASSANISMIYPDLAMPLEISE